MARHDWPDWRTELRFFTSAESPALVTKARLRTGEAPSNAQWLRLAVAEKLERDLGIPKEDTMAKMPPVWEKSKGAIRPKKTQGNAAQSG